MGRRNRRNSGTGVKLCTCDKCGLTLISVPGKKHRRCGGSAGAEVRAKHSIPSTRGVWR